MISNNNSNIDEQFCETINFSSDDNLSTTKCTIKYVYKKFNSSKTTYNADRYEYGDLVDKYEGIVTVVK